MSDIVLAMKDVSAGYGDTLVLENISLAVKKGCTTAILGRNGVGKTTLMATAMGYTRLRSGSITLHGVDVSRMPTHLRSARGLGIVPQTRDIFASLTVEENLVAALRGDAELEEAYSLFPRLKERRRNGGRQLSGGEQQMLSIARALMARPSVLLLDEPLEGLAPVICEMLMMAFTQLANDNRMTLILVEQHVRVALDFAQHALVVDDGRIVYDGPASVLNADEDILNRYIGLALPG